ncbi:MAG TPA: ABC transporter substrate-binding protein [Gaiellaceae bacterium]|nr:ABC transporter substrate-binding protein [Gaiellaceae bacterium]
MTRLLATLVLVALAAVPAAGARSDAPAADPGVTATTVTLGATVPLSGPAVLFGALAPGAKAYFDYVNSRGGVNGRQIAFTYRDDGYEPARTITETRRLVQEDGVFAIFASVGTANNLAVRPLLNAMKVPQLFVGDGSSALSGTPKRYPWTMGYLPSYVGEGAMYGRNIARTRPRARIAVLAEDSPLGLDLLAGLRRGLVGSKAKIVAVQRHDPTAVDVASQVASLRASKADTLLLFTTPLFFIRGAIAVNKLGWKPQLYVNSISIEPSVMATAAASAPRVVRDAISMVWLKDPTNPRWAKDRGVRLYRQLMARYCSGCRVGDVYHYAGMAFAYTMVDALRKAGRNLTRASLLRAATHLNETDNPFLLPGVAVRTSPASYFPIAKAQLYRYRKGRWQPFSGLLGAKG